MGSPRPSLSPAIASVDMKELLSWLEAYASKHPRPTPRMGPIDQHVIRDIVQSSVIPPYQVVKEHDLLIYHHDCTFCERVGSEKCSNECFGVPFLLSVGSGDLGRGGRCDAPGVLQRGQGSQVLQRNFTRKM